MGVDPPADGQMGKEREDKQTHTPHMGQLGQGAAMGSAIPVDRFGQSKRGDLMNSPVSLLSHIHN